PMGNAFESKVPSTFLAGLGNIKKDFQPAWAKEPAAGENFSVELTPRDAQGGLEKLNLVIDRKDFKILQAKIQDVMGNITDIRFSKIQFDNRLPDSLFAFVPPKGVEVFQMPGAQPRTPTEK
ncbi:MAG TPA: outer membrane lipoprotein carrier protein LolA, partial [Thermodesulfobacteriota bacterium]|nr:outer membrane lipoprotein carrier protein LolA [Thermodesulfobacteriota bacterium]